MLMPFVEDQNWHNRPKHAWPVAQTGLAGLVKFLKMQVGLHHYVSHAQTIKMNKWKDQFKINGKTNSKFRRRSYDFGKSIPRRNRSSGLVNRPGRFAHANWVRNCNFTRFCNSFDSLRSKNSTCPGSDEPARVEGGGCADMLSLPDAMQAKKMRCNYASKVPQC